MAGSLDNQVALVTGGGRGIGAVITEYLVDAGAKVAILGRTEASLKETADRLGASVLAITGDVTNADDMKAAVAQTEAQFGPLDLLVNNAGVSGTAGNIADIDPKDWWRTQEINVLGVLLASQAVLPSMLSRGQGRIVHMGSFAGNTPGPGVTDYSVSKTAVLRLNESLASEIGDSGLVSIGISPGVVETDMVKHFNQVFQDTRDDWEGFGADMIFPAEVAAELIVRIAKGDADALNGRFIHVKDGLDTILENLDRVQDEELLLLRLRQL